MSTASNRLSASLSLYLKQHADNPVDWYPWGEEALARAREENKPILVSIGYSTCYWCHVMEDDVFENADIAKIMNEHFINIKVDREERPEIDEIYMVARQLMTKQGGWPNNVFLTPDLKPFYAGGTFASDNRYGTMGFGELLTSLSDAWKNRREEVEQTATQAGSAIMQLLQTVPEPLPKGNLEKTLVLSLHQYLSQQHDGENGGFYKSPKFPHENYLLFLLEYYRKFQVDKALQMAQLTLKRMAAGGMHDQLGGGFHRYAVDGEWKVPHFEKMLYNQALLGRCFSDLYSITQNPYHRDIAMDTLNFSLKELCDKNGAFFAALDAETDGVEGEYYVWNDEEIATLLSEEEKNLFDKCFDIAPIPEFPGHKHPSGGALFARGHMIELSEKKELSYEELHDKLEPVINKLYEARAKREQPHLDNKIITAWNGMMIDALARASKTLDQPHYLDAAKKAADTILKECRNEDGTLARIYADGQAILHGYLEDYAHMAQGLLSVYQVSGDEEYRKAAFTLLDEIDAHFLDTDTNTYFFTDEKDQTLVRIRQAKDSAIPSCTGVLLGAWLDAYELTEEDKWLDKSEKILVAYSGALAQIPAEYATLLLGLMRYLKLKDT